MAIKASFFPGANLLHPLLRYRQETMRER